MCCMKIATNITHIHEGKEVVRGRELEDLICNHSFVEAIALTLTGTFPEEHEVKMLNALFTAVIDHGPAVASALNARISVSAKNSTHTSLAAGILGFGPRHGMASQGAMEFFYAYEGEDHLLGLLTSMKEKKQYVSGFGHKIFTVDPRSETLFGIAKDLGIYSTYCTFAKAVHTALNEMSSKPLPINIDGAIAAILCDMGYDARLGQSIFLIGRVPGLLAQILEEQENDTGVRRLPEEDILQM
jgi:citryl-CoA lyase